MRNVYEEVTSRIKNINFEKIWPGFKIIDFALYDEEMVYFDTYEIPRTNDFLGNTIIEYEGKIIAIWNVTDEDRKNLDKLTSNMVHEMFHGFQRTENDLREVKELRLLDYPLTADVYWRKNREHELLIASYKEEDPAKTFQEYLQLKKARFLEYPELIDEFQVETLEGMAEFSGLKALQQLSIENYEKDIDSHLEKLKSSSETFFNPRLTAYFVGSLQLIMAHRLGMDIFHKLNTKETAFEILSRDIEAVSKTENPDDGFQQFVNEKIRERAQKFDKFYENEYETIEFRSRFCGYDPMNMVKAGDKILCSHFAFMCVGDEREFVQGPLVLTLEPDSLDKIVKYDVLTKN